MESNDYLRVGTALSAVKALADAAATLSEEVAKKDDRSTTNAHYTPMKVDADGITTDLLGTTICSRIRPVSVEPSLTPTALEWTFFVQDELEDRLKHIVATCYVHRKGSVLAVHSWPDKDQNTQITTTGHSDFIYDVNCWLVDAALKAGIFRPRT